LLARLRRRLSASHPPVFVPKDTSHDNQPSRRGITNPRIGLIPLSPLLKRTL
jgi:hypothetical protein